LKILSILSFLGSLDENSQLSAKSGSFDFKTGLSGFTRWTGLRAGFAELLPGCTDEACRRGL
jgi:hypothetical protein